MCRKLRRSGQFGRQRHQPNMALRSFEETIENRNVRRKKMLSRLHPALGMRKKRPLKMNSNWKSGVLTVRPNQSGILNQPGQPSE